MKKIYFIATLSFLICNYVFSQFSISGKVTDKKTTKPVIGANINIPEHNMNAISDMNGAYEIKNVPAGKYHIAITYIGYATITETVDLKENLNLNFVLDISVTELKKVEVIGIKEGSVVNGYRIDTAEIGTFGRIPIRDIPFSINVTPGELIENTQSHNLLDALKTNPTVAPISTPNNVEYGGTTVYIRGFSPNYMCDGLYINAFQQPSISNLERIEVLNGVNGIFYGFLNIGGCINYVTRKPQPDQQADITFGNYNQGVNYVNADITGPIDKKKKLTYRFNAYSENGTTYISGQKQQGNTFSGALSYNVFDKTIITIDASNQYSLLEGQQSGFTVLPSKGIMVPSASAFTPTTEYGQPWTYNKFNISNYGISIISKINSIFSFRGSYRFSDCHSQYNYITSSFTDNIGNFKEVDQDFAPNHRYYNTGFALIDASFKWLNMQHDITAGYVGYNCLIHFGGNPTATYTLGNSNISNSIHVEEPYGIDTLNNSYINYNRYYWQALMLCDRITINKYCSVVAGLTDGIYTVNRISGNLKQNAAYQFTQNKITPLISFIVKPVKNLSVYASYAQGVESGSIAPSTAKNSGELLNPGVDVQYEGGVKYSLKGINITAAVFQINKNNVYTDPTDTIYKRDGREVHKGGELTVNGKICKGLSIGGGYTFLNAEVTHAANNPSIEGKIPVDVPEKCGKIFLEYMIPHVKGFSVYTTVSYIGKRPVDAANLNFIPDFTTFDAGLRYSFIYGEKKHNVNFNLCVLNVTGCKYFAAYDASCGLRLSTPRLLSLSVNFKL